MFALEERGNAGLLAACGKNFSEMLSFNFLMTAAELWLGHNWFLLQGQLVL